MLDQVSNPIDFVCTAILAGGSGNGDDFRFREWFAGALRTKMRTTLCVHPYQAEIMLETNTGNRTLSIVRAEKYAEDIVSNDWELTGEPIIFSDEGILNDGQTRLKACLLAGKPFTTHVTFGIPRRAFKVTGIGAKRSLSDAFSIEGYKHSVRLAAALNWLNKYLNGWGERPLNAVKGFELLHDHPDIKQSCEVGTYLYTETRFIGPSEASFLHYICALKDKDQADAFFSYLSMSPPSLILPEKDPRVSLWQRLDKNSKAKAKLSPREVAALTIKAWNFHRKNETTGSLRWLTNPTDGKAPEPFPTAI